MKIPKITPIPLARTEISENILSPKSTGKYPPTQ